MRMMIVDDSHVMRAMMRQVFADSAGEFCECRDGAEAFEAYGKFFPDIVLMDVRMKGMDGLSATRAIMKEYPDARIVVVTQYRDPTIEVRAREAGAMHFVLKERLLDVKEILGAS